MIVLRAVNLLYCGLLLRTRKSQQEVHGNFPSKFGNVSMAKMSECLVEVYESTTHGRGLRAKRDIKPGELLLKEKPFSYVLYHSESLNPSFCDHCFAEK